MNTQLRRLETGNQRSVANKAGTHRRGAFTLVEMLIVVAVIGVLAALTFPVMKGVKATQLRTRARGELAKVETAIETYKSKQGYYPPDSTPNYVTNQLYYELLGTTNVGTGATPVYQTLDGSARIAAVTLTNVFGPNVTGIMNCTRGGGGDEGASARAYLKDLKPSQYLTVSITNGGVYVATVLGAALDGPEVLHSPNNERIVINPWRYNSSNPRHNTKSFDLWIDVWVAGKIYRICNWSDQPLIVSDTFSY
jgi:prepilin-type N-terminal cleavage/methylation domain-containing protein